MKYFALYFAFGAAGCSALEHFLNLNFADKVIAIFRSAKDAVAAAERKIEAATSDLRKAVSRVAGSK